MYADSQYTISNVYGSEVAVCVVYALTYPIFAFFFCFYFLPYSAFITDSFS